MNDFFLPPTAYRLPPDPRRGLTILELLIFSAIFTVIIVIFITVMVSVTRVQVRQEAAVEVNNQSQFILQTVERYVAQSSVVEMDKDVASSSLRLRMPSAAVDPTVLYATNGVLYVTEGNGAPFALTTDKIAISGLTFTKRASLGGHDSVSVVFTADYNTQSIAQRFSQLFGTSIARVSAATFDSDLVPAISDSYKLGLPSQKWQSINSTIYFSGSNVGIGTVSPGQVLEVSGGMRLNTSASKPACDATTRGTFWVAQSGAGSKDAVDVCVKKANDSYFWSGIY